MMPMSMPRSSAAWPVYAVALVYFLLIVVWSLSIPFNGAPDEATHFYLVEYLYKFGSVPRPGIDPSSPVNGLLSGIYLTKEAFWYFGLPYLNALGAVGTAFATSGLFPDGTTYLSARAFNWLLAPCFAFSMLSIGRSSGLNTSTAIVSAAIFLLVPQATFLFSYFNADAFPLTVTAMALAFLLACLKTNSTWHALGFGMSCGLILCSKIYYFPALVFFVIMIVAKGMMEPGFAVARVAVVAILGCLVVAVPVLGVTYAKFGDVTGINGQILFTDMLKDRVEKLCYLGCEDRFFHWKNLYTWLSSAFVSFFFGLGWLTIFARPAVYYFFFAPLIVVLFGASLFVSIRKVMAFQREELPALWLPLMAFTFWSMAAAVVMSNILGSQRLLPQAQGRYVYVVVPFAYYLLASMLGSRCAPTSSLRWGVKRPRVLPALLLGVATTMGLLNLYGIGRMLAAGDDPSKVPLMRMIAFAKG